MAPSNLSWAAVEDEDIVRSAEGPCPQQHLVEHHLGHAPPPWMGREPPPASHPESGQKNWEKPIITILLRLFYYIISLYIGIIIGLLGYFTIDWLLLVTRIFGCWVIYYWLLLYNGFWLEKLRKTERNCYKDFWLLGYFTIYWLFSVILQNRDTGINQLQPANNRDIV